MMQTPISYKKLFGDDHVLHNTIKDLHVSSALTITILSIINHRLFININPDAILQELSARWQDGYRKIFANGINRVNSKSDNSLALFSEWTVTEFLKHELLNHNDLKFENHDPTGLLEVLVILRYFKYVDILLETRGNFEIINDENHEFDFKRTLYPSLIKQFQFTIKPSPVLDVLCCYSFLKEMKREFPEITKSYLKQYEVEGEWEFATSMIRMISDSVSSSKDSKFPLVAANSNGHFHKVYENRAIDIIEYKENEKLQMRYVGLQSKPFYQLDNVKLCVMSFRFLYNNIGTGVLFDFFSRTSIKEIYDSMGAFKASRISLPVYEQGVFRPLMESLFTRKNVILQFDEGVGNPDCYMRRGKNLFLFEFKDMWFSDEIVTDGTYEDIVEICKRNLIKNKNGRPKGFGQIANQIKKLDEHEYEFDEFTTKGIKRSSVTIFPIVVYSHRQFSFPGFNEYIADEFEQIKPINSFKHVVKPILISLDYLFSRSMLFHSIGLDKIIKKYHLQISKHKSYVNRVIQPDETKYYKSLFGQYNSIEQCRIQFKEIDESNRTLNDPILRDIFSRFGVDGSLAPTA